MSTKAQEVYEAVNALVDSGVAKRDAFEQVARERSLTYDGCRGSYYSHRRAVEGTSSATGSRSRRVRRRDTTPEDAVNSAIEALRVAVRNIQAEVTIAAERAQEAQAEHAHIAASATGRIEEIQTKIVALGGEPEPLEALLTDKDEKEPARNGAPVAEEGSSRSGRPKAKAAPQKSPEKEASA